MELVGVDAPRVRVAAHLVERHQLRPAVEGGVLDTLGHHGAAHLLEPDDQLVPLRSLRASGDAQLAAQHEIDHHVEGFVQVGVQGGARQPGRLVHDLDGRLRRRLAGDDVGAVPVQGDDHLGQAGADPGERVVAQHDVVAADRVGQRREPVHLGEQAGGGHLALGGGDHLRQRAGDVAGDGVGDRGQVAGTVGVAVQRRDAPGRVVAGGAGHGPVGGELLVALQDLLRADPGAAGGHRQPAQVAARVGQTVGVVDAERVDVPGVEQIQQQRVGGVEDRGVLDADRHQGVDVEEAAEVQLLVGDLPVREPVELLLDAQGQRQVLGARADREDVVVVDQDGLRAGVLEAGDDAVLQRDLTVGQHGADPGTQHRHQHPLPALVGAVEPRRVRRRGTVLEHRPQRQVVGDRRRDAHVVGHHVDDDAHTAGVRVRGQPLEARASAHHLGDGGVVDHVVAVRAARCRGQDRGQVQVGDAEVVEVVQVLARLVEREVRPQLQPVGGHRRAASGRGQVGDVGVAHRLRLGHSVPPRIGCIRSPQAIAVRPIGSWPCHRARLAGLFPIRDRARVAEWQTRTVQVRVSERTWRFNSSLAHHRTPGQIIWPGVPFAALAGCCGGATPRQDGIRLNPDMGCALVG